MLDGALLTPAQLGELADLPSREVLLARVAGAFQAPLAQLASLLQALPRNLAYGLKALVDERGGVPVEAPSTAEAAAPETEAAAPETGESAQDAAVPDAG
jgi:large subunit ribosomal protein L10